MKLSKFTCKEIYHTKHSLCRCSRSISLITDISIMLSQKASLLSISTQCTSSFNKYYSTPITENFLNKIDFSYSIQCTCSNFFFSMKIMQFTWGLSSIPVSKTPRILSSETWYLSLTLSCQAKQFHLLPTFFLLCSINVHHLKY